MLIYFNPVSSIHSYYTRQSQNDNLFVNSGHTAFNTASFSPLKYIVQTFGILYLDLLIGCQENQAVFPSVIEGYRLLLIPEVLGLYFV